jgi:two-component system cell cycle sensor histidine kinase/response regulator CckA
MSSEAFSDDYLGRVGRDALRAETLDALYQGVVVTDPSLEDGPIVYANDAFLRLTGYPREEIVGFNCRFLQGPGTDRDEVARLRRALTEGESYFGELLNYRKDGSAFWNALAIRPLRDGDGAVTHFVASQTDVTPLKELQLKAQQQQRLELLGGFSGAIAHDFNNILVAVNGYAELLGQRSEDPKVVGYAARILEAGRSGSALTKQLLAFSRGRPLQRDDVDLSALVEQTIALFSRLLPAGVALRASVDPGIVLRADRSQLEQLLVNLIVNARDAVDPPGSIEVRLAANAESVTLVVADTGCGMTPEVEARVFERFFTTKEAGTGTGLGLATVSAVVSGHGGSLGLQTAPGAGSTFTVELPRAA